MALHSWATVAALILAQCTVPSLGASLASVLKSFHGKYKVDCDDVCGAVGGSSRGWSSSWSGTTSTMRCSCASAGKIIIDCEVLSSGAFKTCCEQGKDCSVDLKPSSLEKREAKAVAKSGRGSRRRRDSRRRRGSAVAADGKGCGACGTRFVLNAEEIAVAMEHHNKMRKAVGSPALKWDCKLMCQAQRVADTCKFEHSDSYRSPIKAGENLAQGKDGSMAAWMWFSEYGIARPGTRASPSQSGHFTAMVWKSTKKLGCGVCKEPNAGSGGVYVCQYAGAAANYGGAKAEKDNVPVFDGTSSQFRAAGLDPETAKNMFKKFKGWGLNVGSALERFYGLDDLPALPAQAPYRTAALASASAALIVVFFAGVALRRRSSPRHVLLAGDAEQAACALVVE